MKKDKNIKNIKKIIEKNMTNEQKQRYRETRKNITDEEKQ